MAALNNEGVHEGDACAGEVMCALRGHGWIISMEEQDTHELFHALTATLDEELINILTTPSLLDISWMEENTLNIFEDGVLLKATSLEYINRDYSIKKENGINLDGEAVHTSQTNGIVKLSENGNKSDLLFKLDSTITNQSCDNFSIGIKSLDIGSEVIVNDSHVKRSSQGCDQGNCDNEDSSSSLKDAEQVCVNGKEYGYTGNNCSAQVSSELPDSSSGMKDCVDDTLNQEYNKSECRTENNGSLSEVKDSDESHESLTNVTQKQEDAEKGAVDRYWKTRPDQQDSPFRGYLASQLQCILCSHKV